MRPGRNPRPFCVSRKLELRFKRINSAALRIKSLKNMRLSP
nr:MAG TPA: hypothetical protein [Caudoviricetes sp.]